MLDILCYSIVLALCGYIFGFPKALITFLFYILVELVRIRKTIEDIGIKNE